MDVYTRCFSRCLPRRAIRFEHVFDLNRERVERGSLAEEINNGSFAGFVPDKRYGKL